MSSAIQRLLLSARAFIGNHLVAISVGASLLTHCVLIYAIAVTHLVPMRPKIVVVDSAPSGQQITTKAVFASPTLPTIPSLSIVHEHPSETGVPEVVRMPAMRKVVTEVPSHAKSASVVPEFDEHVLTQPIVRQKPVADKPVRIDPQAVPRVKRQHIRTPLLVYAKADVPPPAKVVSNTAPLSALPRFAQRTEPDYPDALRNRGIEGTVVLRIEVDAKGHVSLVSIKRSSGHAELDKSAMAAARRWRFTPAMRGNMPVALRISLPVVFRIASRVSAP